ncbi:hypothetical protein [Lacimicrobium alkaliphilum]|uniref:DUF2780 domain-containing protein n=1 Tax=Lacimicrobium alkaliphilum TaxID=1526571 RepID=A0ABQ1RQB9_9ALTE|nr:hypothetical protein [Lacimicrobium alkaliphilum]GGD76789.1 hypothetical protein GCM10011357_34800 [Lacimicrobium alkaliphilum]
MKFKYLSIIAAGLLSVSSVQAQQTDFDLAALQEAYNASGQTGSFVAYVRQQLLPDSLISSNPAQAEQTLTSLLGQFGGDQTQLSELLSSLSSAGMDSDSILASAVGAGIDPTQVTAALGDTATAALAAGGAAPSPGALGLGAGTGGGGGTASEN